MRIYQNYDASGQMTGQSVYLGDKTYSQSYTYNTTDGSLKTMSPGVGGNISYTYDVFKRLTTEQNSRYTKTYTYHNKGSQYTTEQVAQLTFSGLPTNLTYAYTYDNVGNIATYTAPGKNEVTYTYDNQGQLLSAVGAETYAYTYDGVGNILTANGHTYTYGDTNWRDLLTAYDGETITYDASGNPLSYYNGTRWAFTWENGRSLATATDGTTNISYAYDASGLRTSKVVNGVTHNYFYASGQLMRETYGNNTLDFFYDASGYPYALKYNGTTYYYITNLQGDVMYLVDANENTVASYEYDPYGNIVSATGTMAEINPLRYRGYYFDTDLEMYYLQSRYYDPVVCRFVNRDDLAYLGSSDAILGYNLFAYCMNSPCNYTDDTGCWAENCFGFNVVANGFIVRYSSAFLNKNYCLLYARNVAVSCGKWNFWNGHTFMGMTPLRMAKELYAHAVFYNIGVATMLSSRLAYILDMLIIKCAGLRALKLLSTVSEKKAYLQHEMGFYLFDKSKEIHVNYDEYLYRVMIYEVIWQI